MVSKMLTIHSVDEVFTLRAVIVPGDVKGEDFLCNRNFTDTIFCFTVNHIKISFFQMNISFSQIKKFGDTDTIIDEHENGLIITFIGVFP